MYRLIVRLVLVLVLMSFLSTSAGAQDKYKVSSVSVGSGDTPISSGLAVSVNLTTEGGGFMQVMAQAEQAWFMIGKDWTGDTLKCSLYASVGHFQSAPWAGPYAGCTAKLAKVRGNDVTAGIMTWPGFYIGREPRNWRNDGRKNPESVLAGYFSTASVGVGGFQASLSHLNFLDEKTNWLPGIGYTQKVRSDVSVSGSVTLNSNAKQAMYFLAATWSK